MFKDYTRYTLSLIQLNEVILNPEGIYLNTHTLICMLSSNYKGGRIIKQNYAIDKGKACLSLRFTEQQSGQQLRAALPLHQGEDLKKGLRSIGTSKGLL